MKKTALITIAIVAPLAFVGRWYRHEARLADTKDMVKVAAVAVHAVYLKNPNPSQDELKRALFALKSESATNLQVGPDGRPADSYRTSLRIHHEVKGKQAITTVTSAGADRSFDTDDDVREVVTSDLPGKP